MEESKNEVPYIETEKLEISTKIDAIKIDDDIKLDAYYINGKFVGEEGDSRVEVILEMAKKINMLIDDKINKGE